MKKIRLSIRIIFCLAAVLAGCKDNMPDTASNHGGERRDPVNAVFRIQVSSENNTPTRAAGEENAPDYEETPGNDMECRINTLHLFAVPLDENKEEDWNNVSTGSISLFGKPDAGGLKAEIPVDLKISGDMNVYVGANLSKEQENAFMKKAQYKTGREKYYQAINEFAPFITKEPEWNRYPQNIAMFCHVATPATTVGADKDEEVVKISVAPIELRRMVAKVLVTCTVKEGANGVNYVPLDNDLKRGTEDLGWIRQSDVFYFVNNMPRKTQFIQYHAEDETGELQPYYNLREAMKTLAFNLLPLSFNATEINENFIHYDMAELYKRNSSFQPSSVWSDEEYRKLITADGKSAYSRAKVGMYTLENLFEINDGDFSEDELIQMWEFGALPMITHAAIAAKFTPKYIFVTKDEWNYPLNGEQALKDREVTADGETKPLEKWMEATDNNPGGEYLTLKCPNEETAKKVLTYSLARAGKLWKGEGTFDPDDHKGSYPAETFFAYSAPDDTGGGISYCSYGTAASFNTPGEVDESMVPYTNGWSYYYTYINNTESRAITTKEQLKDACVERNHYYILNVLSIGKMGTTVTNPKYMRVHTLKAEWKDGGSGETTLH